MKDEDGKPVKVDEISEVSDGLAIQLLKAHRPEKYREPKQQLSASVSALERTSVQFNVGVTAEELPC